LVVEGGVGMSEGVVVTFQSYNELHDDDRDDERGREKHEGELTLPGVRGQNNLISTFLWVVHWTNGHHSHHLGLVHCVVHAG
jgi:hypothetical protein